MNLRFCEIYIKYIFYLEQVFRKSLGLPTCYLDEDLSNDKAKEAYGLGQFSYYNFSEKASWIEPELLQLPKEKLEEYT